MILKGLKQKSHQKHINKLLNSRNSSVTDSKIESIGVILNLSEFDGFEAFRELANDLKINPNKIKIIAYTEDQDLVRNSRELLFSNKQIGWNTKIKNPELHQFLNTSFDALCCFFNNELPELQLVSALSKANFKIGLSGNDDRLFDLIINTSSNQFNIFTKELKKYLNILNKI